MKKFFSIDIGSNTIMLTSAQQFKNIDKNTNKKILIGTQWKKQGWIYHDFFQFASLAKGMEKTHCIAKERLEAALEILKKYRSIIENDQANEICVCITATSAMREAQNKQWALDKMQNTLAMPINVIDGEKEGTLTFLGSANHIKKPVIIIDIGGGSTEIIFAHHQKIKKIISLPIGALRWKDKFPATALCREETQEKAIETINHFIEKVWQNLDDNQWIEAMQHCFFYAVAGVPTSLCAIEYGITLSNFEELEEKTISFAKIQDIRKEICSFSPEQIKKDKKKFDIINNNRAEIIGISCIIFETLLNFLHNKLDGEKYVTVSVRGLRYGLLHAMQNNITKKHGLTMTKIFK